MAGSDVIGDFQLGLDHIRLLDGLTVSATTEIDYDHDGVVDSTLLTFMGGSVTALGVLSTHASDFLI